MEFNWIDIVFIVIALVSTVFGLFRGFFAEIASLIILIVAFFVARAVGSAYLVPYVVGPSQSVLLALGYLCVFLVVLLIGIVIMAIVNRIIQETPFSFLNALLGGIFGFLRGIVIIIAILFFVGFTVWSKSDAWKQSYVVEQSQSPGFKEWIDVPELTKKIKIIKRKEEVASSNPL